MTDSFERDLRESLQKHGETLAHLEGVAEAQTAANAKSFERLEEGQKMMTNTVGGLQTSLAAISASFAAHVSDEAARSAAAAADVSTTRQLSVASPVRRNGLDNYRVLITVMGGVAVAAASGVKGIEALARVIFGP